MISIGLCQPQEMVREALVKAIAPMKGVKVLVAERDGDSFIDAVERERPEVMIIDVAHSNGNGNGLDLARRAKAAHEKGKLVALVDDETDEAVVDGFEAGAVAVVSKNRPVKELHKVVLDAAADVPLLTTASVRSAKQRLTENGHVWVDQLDETDRKMLELLTRGFTDRKIANEVCLSLQTVRNRISRLLKRLKLSNRTQLALHASKLNLGSVAQTAPQTFRATASR